MGASKLTSLSGSSLGCDVCSDPVDSVNNTSGGTTAAIAQNLDGNDGGSLGHTVSDTSNVGTDVGSVSVEIRVGGSGNSVVSPSSTALKLGMGDQNTGVDNVGKGTESGRAIVDVRSAGSRFVGDGAKTPRRNGRLGDLLFMRLVMVQWIIYGFAGI